MTVILQFKYRPYKPHVMYKIKDAIMEGRWMDYWNLNRKPENRIVRL